MYVNSFASVHKVNISTLDRFSKIKKFCRVSVEKIWMSLSWVRKPFSLFKVIDISFPIYVVTEPAIRGEEKRAKWILMVAHSHFQTP